MASACSKLRSSVLSTWQTRPIVSGTVYHSLYTMSRVVYHPQSAAQYSQQFFRRWAPSMALWGAGVGVAALYVLSVTPKVKRTFLVKVPVLGSYFEDKTPASDKPF